MNGKNERKIKIYRFDNLSRFSEIEHFITTRKGGFSGPPYEDFNLALHVGDKDSKVLKNREVLSKAVNIDPDNFLYLVQTQSDNVKIVEEGERGAGTRKYVNSIPNTDAVITQKPEICLMVLVADCANILFYDFEKKIIGAIHAGWKGTLKGTTEKAILKAMGEFGCDPNDIKAGLGPSIGPCCLEVKEDVARRVEELYKEEDHVLAEKDGKRYLDLWRANQIQLQNTGIPRKNIEISGICTACHVNEFFSHRKEDITGRFAAGIMLKDI